MAGYGENPFDWSAGAEKLKEKEQAAKTAAFIASLGAGFKYVTETMDPISDHIHSIATTGGVDTYIVRQNKLKLLGPEGAAGQAATPETTDAAEVKPLTGEDVGNAPAVSELEPDDLKYDKTPEIPLEDLLKQKANENPTATVVINQNSALVKNMLKANSTGAPIPSLSINSMGSANMLSVDHLVPERPSLIGIISPPLTVAENSSLDLLQTLRFERSLKNDNISFIFSEEISKMDEFSAASADVANVITQVKTVSDQVSVLRNAVDETSLSLNISATQTSQKILSYALNFYDARKDSSERQTNRLPQNIKSFFEEYMGIDEEQIDMFSNTRILYDIYSAILGSSTKCYPGMLIDDLVKIKPDSHEVKSAPDSDSIHNFIEPFKRTNWKFIYRRANMDSSFTARSFNRGSGAGAANSVGINTLWNHPDSYRIALKGVQKNGSVGQKTGFRSNDVVDGHRKRMKMLCCMLSNELIISAGMSRLVGTPLGKRFGASYPLQTEPSSIASKPLELLFMSEGDQNSTDEFLQSKSTDSSTSKLKIPVASLADALILNEGTSETNAPLVLPFEVSAIIDTQGSSLKYASGKDFFIEIPFRTQSKGEHIEKFASEYASLTSDAVSYLDTLFLQSEKLRLVTPAGIFARVARVLTAITKKLSIPTMTYGVNTIESVESLNLFTSAALFLTAADQNFQLPEGHAASKKPHELRNFLYKLCIMFRDKVTTDAADQSWEKYVADLEEESDDPIMHTTEQARAWKKQAIKQLFGAFAGPNALGARLRSVNPHTQEKDIYSEIRSHMYTKNTGSKHPQYPSTSHNDIQNFDLTNLETASDISLIAEVVQISREIQQEAFNLSKDAESNDFYLDPEERLTLFNRAGEDAIIGAVLEIMISMLGVYLPASPWSGSVKEITGNDILISEGSDADATFLKEAYTLGAETNVNFRLHGLNFDGMIASKMSAVSDAVSQTILDGIDLDFLVPIGTGTNTTGPTTIQGPEGIIKKQDLIGRTPAKGHITEPLYVSDFMKDALDLVKHREFVKVGTGIIGAVSTHLLEKSNEIKLLLTVFDKTHPATKASPEKTAFANFTNSDIGKKVIQHMTTAQANLRAHEQKRMAPLPGSSLPNYSVVRSNERLAVDEFLKQSFWKGIKSDPVTNKSFVAPSDSVFMAVGIPAGMMDFIKNMPYKRTTTGGGSNTKGFKKSESQSNKIKILLYRRPHANQNGSILKYKPRIYEFDLDMFLDETSVNIAPSPLGQAIPMNQMVNNTVFHTYKSGKLVTSKPGSEYAFGKQNRILSNHLTDYLIKTYLYEMTGIRWDASSYPVFEDACYLGVEKTEMFLKVFDSPLMKQKLNITRENAGLIFGGINNLMEMPRTDISNNRYTRSHVGGAPHLNFPMMQKDSSAFNFYSPGFMTNNIAELIGTDPTQLTKYILSTPKLSPARFDLVSDLTTSLLFSPNYYFERSMTPTLFDRVLFILVDPNAFEPTFEQVTQIKNPGPEKPAFLKTMSSHVADIQPEGIQIDGYYAQILHDDMPVSDLYASQVGMLSENPAGVSAIEL